MSYDISIVHPDARQKALSGSAASENEALPAATATKLVDHLRKLGYALEFSGEDHQEFVKTVGSCPIPVSVSKSEVSFAIPFWEGAEAAIAAALVDAVALANACGLAAFDPQSDEWLE